MNESNSQIGWLVSDENGNITELKWDRKNEEEIEFNVSPYSHGITMQYVCEDEEPYEILSGWIFTKEHTMHKWMRSELAFISKKQDNYLKRLSKVEARAKFIRKSTWPENFIVGYTPDDYINHTRVHISCRLLSEYSPSCVIQQAEERLGMPLSGFTHVWNKMAYEVYGSDIDITLAVESQEHKSYFRKHSPSEDSVRNKIDSVMRHRCPELKYNLKIYRVPAYFYPPDNHLVDMDMDEQNFENAFFHTLGNNLKTKMGTAFRNKNLSKTHICAYLISSDIHDKVPSHIMDATILIPSRFAKRKRYAIYRPININVWVRPNNTILLDALLEVGSASVVKFGSGFVQNILDQLVE